MVRQASKNGYRNDMSLRNSTLHIQNSIVIVKSLVNIMGKNYCISPFSEHESILIDLMPFGNIVK